MMSAYRLSSVVIVLSVTVQVFSSEYDPHVFPVTGPYLEGWYARFVDFAAKRSIGVILASSMPADSGHTDHLAFVGLLHSEHGQKLRSYAALPEVRAFNVTVRGGQPITCDPDITSPAEFEVRVASIGLLSVKPNVTTVSLRVEDMHVEATFGSGVAWGTDGEGPQSWANARNLGRLLPVNWFVYSLRSPVLSYKLENTKDGTVYLGQEGYAHMEKNWGGSFPRAWVWSQGISNTHNDITFVLSYAVIDFHNIMDFTGHLFGYRNPSKDIVVNMSPLNSMLSITETDGCRGQVDVTLTGWMYKVKVKVTAQRSSFSDCLYCPKQNGFQRGSTQSFSVLSEVTVYYRTYLLYFQEVDSHIFIDHVALEFGAMYTCDNQC